MPRHDFLFCYIFTLCQQKFITTAREREHTSTHTHHTRHTEREEYVALSFALPRRCMSENDRQNRRD